MLLSVISCAAVVPAPTHAEMGMGKRRLTYAQWDWDKASQLLPEVKQAADISVALCRNRDIQLAGNVVQLCHGILWDIHGSRSAVCYVLLWN